MSESAESALRRASEELRSIYEGSVDGIFVVDADSRRFVRANQAICELLGYTEKEILSLSVADIHPAKDLPEVLNIFEAMRHGQQECAQNVPCKRKDGSVVYVDVAAKRLEFADGALLLGFFRDATEQNRAAELLTAAQERYRLIAENVADVIWTVPIALSDFEKKAVETDVAAVVDAILDRWRFSFVSPSVARLLGYTPDEMAGLSLRDVATPASCEQVRDLMIRNFLMDSPPDDGDHRQHIIEGQLVAKDGSLRWCETASTYLRNQEGLPTGILGIARDISSRRQAEQALRESESMLRGLFEHLPDAVVIVDRAGKIHFINRVLPEEHLEQIHAGKGLDIIVPEHREPCLRAIQQVFETGFPQTVEAKDIFSRWWLLRAVVLATEGFDDRTMVIATNITQERLANEAVNKEQRLLRQLLELHERERRLMAYDIHDGFAQQLVGALFRLQGFRELHARDSARAWESLDSAVLLISRAVDDARRLISGLRPPVLDEAGVIQAIEYLVCEHAAHDRQEIEFVHDVAFDRLAPPLETALFRIVQESLHNACQHSQSDRIRVEMVQRDGRVHIDVRDWGVGFQVDAVEEQRFGLQGIRERVRLLDGRVVIESAPGKGTHISVELPLVDDAADATKRDATDGESDA